MLEEFQSIIDDEGETVLSPNVEAILKERYYLKNEDETLKETTWAQLCARVATAVARPTAYPQSGFPDEDVPEFFRMLYTRRFLPGSPTLMNAGTRAGTLSSCFVIKVEDTLDHILECAKLGGLIHKYAGGVGYDLSDIRPRNSHIVTTQGKALGPLGVLEIMSTIGNKITQGGRRHGANMCTLDARHPDITSFITCKDREGDITNFNLSVRLDDEFMRAIDTPGSDETKLFDLIAEQAWKNGEPGIMFWDLINKDNPLEPALGPLDGVNPCGEQPLYHLESCNLGSINLWSMYDPEGNLGVDWGLLETTVRTAVRFLDNVIDANIYPVPEIKEATRRTRKIGLGVMGLADLLYEQGVVYGSAECETLCEALAEFILQTAIDESERLYETRGGPPVARDLPEDSSIGRRRNSLITTIAPTGSIGMIADVSPGIEPNFHLRYVKTVMDGAKLTYFNHVLERLLDGEGVDCLALQNMEDQDKAEQELRNVMEELLDNPEAFVIAQDIPWQQHLRVQSIWQRYTHNAVSKTINMPNSTTVEDVKAAIKAAYSMGCKGLTLYRDGSREEQVYESSRSKDRDEFLLEHVGTRPQVVHGDTATVETGCGSLYITVNFLDGYPFEVWAMTGKGACCAATVTEAVCRVVSTALRAGVDIEEITHQLRYMRCVKPTWMDGKAVLSCMDAMAIAIEAAVESYQRKAEITGLPEVKSYGEFLLSSMDVDGEDESSIETCDNCGSPGLIEQEGCIRCDTCGHGTCV
jgi:ribonucleoside-diphosphate reductase alpha chain